MNHNKTICFIDGQNLYLSTKSQNIEIDYKKLYLYLKNKFKIDKAIIYLGFIEENQKLYDYLDKCGFELHFKRVSIKYNNDDKKEVKGNVDVYLTVDVFKNFDNFDTAIFISNDGDFESLYSYLQEKDKSIKILVTSKYSYLLRIFQKELIKLELNKIQKMRGIPARSKPF